MVLSSRAPPPMAASIPFTDLEPQIHTLADLKIAIIARFDTLQANIFQTIKSECSRLSSASRSISPPSQLFSNSSGRSPSEIPTEIDAEGANRMNHLEKNEGWKYPLIILYEPTFGIASSFVSSCVDSSSLVKSATNGGVMCLETKNGESFITKIRATNILPESEFIDDQLDRGGGVAAGMHAKILVKGSSPTLDTGQYRGLKSLKVSMLLVTDVAVATSKFAEFASIGGSAMCGAEVSFFYFINGIPLSRLSSSVSQIAENFIVLSKRETQNELDCCVVLLSLDESS